MRPDLISERARGEAEYIIDTDCTLRAAAPHFAASKSTVHKDVTERLKEIDPLLYRQVSAVLAKNKSERHLRGGAATKAKYALAR